MTTATTERPRIDRPPVDHEGLTVPELLDLLDGRRPRRVPAARRTPPLVTAARSAATTVRRTAAPAAAVLGEAARSAGAAAVRSVRTAWRTYEAWPRRA
jgi:hypothetical protein